jgi:hypothetical protein
MSLTWNQFVHAPLRSLPRSALVVPIAASLVVHAGLLVTIVCIKWDPFARPAHVTDAPTETVLTLTQPAPQPAPQPEAQPTPPPPPPPPPPVQPVAAPAHDELAPPQTQAAEPQPEPPPPVIVHVPLPTPQPVAAAPAPPPPPTPISFAGVEAQRARRVVYVVDASGAMTSSLKFVKEELVRSIARLDSTQSYQIIVFRDLPGEADGEGHVETPAEGLMPATNQSRLASATWLANIQPGGRSDPLVGLTAALKLKPDLVFLLTRSIRRSGPTADWGAGTKATLEALDKLNPAGRDGIRPTVIKAIQFLDQDPTGLLPAIANTHGDGPGSYKVLTLKEINGTP